MLRHYASGGKTGYAPREAVCGWVANNTDYLKSLIPPNHPKVFQYRDDYTSNLTFFAYMFGVIALVYTIFSTNISIQKRETAVFVYAQVQFIFVVLLGLLMVAIGSILYGIEPNDTICTTRIWLINLGYTFELVPLVIKVTALNHLMKASQRMRRISIKPGQLYSSVFALAAMLGIYLVLWTSLDPPMAKEFRRLEDDLVTVTSHFGCRSESAHWQTGSNLWEGLLVLWASVLAFQTRKVQAEFNESKSLGMMSYSHFIFLVLRVIAAIVFEDDAYKTSISTSYLLSLDVIVSISIYLLPKMVKAADTTLRQRPSNIRLSGLNDATMGDHISVRRSSGSITLSSPDNKRSDPLSSEMHSLGADETKGSVPFDERIRTSRASGRSRSSSLNDGSEQEDRSSTSLPALKRRSLLQFEADVSVEELQERLIQKDEEILQKDIELKELHAKIRLVEEENKHHRTLASEPTKVEGGDDEGKKEDAQGYDA